MKLTIVINDFLGLGCQRVAVTLANRLSARHTVAFVVVRGHGVFRARLNDRVRVEEVEPTCLLRRVPKARVPETLLRLAKAIAGTKANAVISFTQSTNLASLMARRLTPAVTILQEQADIGHMFADPQYSRGMKWLYGLTLRRYGSADAVVSCSRAIREDLVHRFGVPAPKVRVIADPIDVRELATLAQAPCDEYDFDPRYRHLMAAGRFTYQKNFPLLLRSFAAARRRHDALRLLIIGEGQGERELRELIGELGLQDAVTVLPFQPNLSRFMVRADLLVLSSRYEGLPQVIAEAMGLGLPVLSTDCPTGPAEMLRDGETGFLVRPDDEQALADAMLRVIDDRPRLASVGAAAKTYALEHYDVERVAAQYEDLIASLA